MNLIRIYTYPKGYIDITCNHVEIESKKAIVRGGQHNNEIYYPVRGVKVIRENVYEQLELELDYGDKNED